MRYDGLTSFTLMICNVNVIPLNARVCSVGINTLFIFSRNVKQC